MKLKIMPWVEEARDNQFGRITAGLNDWAKAVDTAIVSTAPGRADLYTRLDDAVSLTIIPGLKPNDGHVGLLPTFDDVEGWERVAHEVGLIRDTSESDTVLLDLERAGLKYRNGDEDIELDRLADGLELLPNDLDYIWYPSIKAHEFPYFERHKAVCEVAAMTLGRRVRFTDRSVEEPSALDDWWMVRAHRTLMGLSMEPTLPMAYVYEEGKIRWPSDVLPALFEHIEGEWGGDAEFILYPGGKNWNNAAKEIGALLSMYYWLRG